MLAISNGILLIQHYSHGELNTVSLFVSADTSCSSHVDEVSDSCCSGGCSCNHEAAVQHYNFSTNASPLLSEAQTACCFENHAWLHLENSFRAERNSLVLADFDLIAYPLFHFILNLEDKQIIPFTDPPPASTKVSKSILLSTFLC